MIELSQVARSILLIEDHRDVADMIGQHLESRHYDVDVAFDGNCGLRLAQSRDYDVIVLDVTLPGMDGLDLFRALRSSKDHVTPVVVVAEKACVENRASLVEAGIDDYLVKPFALAELDARIESVLAAALRSSHVTAKKSGRVRQPRPDVRALRGGERMVPSASATLRSGTGTVVEPGSRKAQSLS